MIEASFDRMSRRAAIDGAYQYDTGQRLRLSGLPSPEEMNETDDFLSGNIAAVQVQFARLGDSQTQMRLASWEEDRFAWLVSIPDEYLTRSEEVQVFVYVNHGADAGGSRSKTMYAGVFTPIRRPAPEDIVSEDQKETWEALEAEVDLVLSGAQTAIDKANQAANNANQAAEETQKAAQDAAQAAENAENAGDRLEATEARYANLAVRTTDLPEGSEATATLYGDTLTLGLPIGATGPAGEQGPTGPAEFEMSFSDGILTITPR